jgi:phosphoglycolate phosphatase-like HAD superfamily hydrolase
MKDTLVIFDIDGTLTDSVPTHHDCFTKGLTALGVERKKDGFGDYKHHTDRYIFRAIYEENHGTLPSEEIVDQFYEQVEAFYEVVTKQKPLQEIAGATQFLEALTRAEIPFVFATGSIWDPALRKLSLFEIDGVEERLASSDRIDSREGIVNESIRKACAYYGRPDFKTKVVLGDGKWDLVTGRNLGFPFIGIGANEVLKALMTEAPEALWPDFQNRTVEDMFDLMTY